MRLCSWFAVVVTLLVSATACGGSDSAAHPAPTLTGRVVAPECDGGYEIESAQITLRDESDDIIGTATTGKNKIDATFTASTCVVEFRIRDVPRAKFYSLKIGSHEGPAWSRKQLAHDDFKAELTLGDAVIPKGSQDDVCVGLSDLHDVFNDTDLLNDDPDKWTLRLKSFETRFGSAAAGLDLADKDELASDVDDLAFALSIFSYDGYASTKQLNRKVTAINTPAAAITSRIACKWDPVSYS